MSGTGSYIAAGDDPVSVLAWRFPDGASVPAIPAAGAGTRSERSGEASATDAVERLVDSLRMGSERGDPIEVALSAVSRVGFRH